MLNSGTIIFLIFAAFSTNISAGGGLHSYINNHNDEMATSTCISLSSASHKVTGHIAAVRRTYGSGPSCSGACKNAPAVP